MRIVSALGSIQRQAAALGILEDVGGGCPPLFQPVGGKTWAELLQVEGLEDGAVAQLLGIALQEVWDRVESHATEQYASGCYRLLISDRLPQLRWQTAVSLRFNGGTCRRRYELRCVLTYRLEPGLRNDPDRRHGIIWGDSWVALHRVEDEVDDDEVVVINTRLHTRKGHRYTKEQQEHLAPLGHRRPHKGSRAEQQRYRLKLRAQRRATRPPTHLLPGAELVLGREDAELPVWMRGLQLLTWDEEEGGHLWELACGGWSKRKWWVNGVQPLARYLVETIYLRELRDKVDDKTLLLSKLDVGGASRAEEKYELNHVAEYM